MLVSASLDGAGLVATLEASGLLDAAALQQVALLLAVAVGPVLTQGHSLAGAGCILWKNFRTLWCENMFLNLLYRNAVSRILHHSHSYFIYEVIMKNI